MVPQKSGVVLSISSVHEQIAWSGYSAYTASKAAAGMLTKTLAQEAAPHGVRVNALAPGATEEQVEEALIEQIEKIKSDGVTAAEIAPPIARYTSSPSGAYAPTREPRITLPDE